MAHRPQSVLSRNAPIDKLVGPFQRFTQLEAAGGIVLIIFTVIALVWANSAWAQSYMDLFSTKFTVGVESFKISKPVLLWVNDGLMAIFFFVVGLEIKRELLVGELSSPRKAAVPLFAAIGGMLVPAAIFAAINWNKPGINGWGVPMATDIAFAVGVLALLGSRVPIALKVFLTALAIVDDLGAVMVIAIFYTEQINMTAIAVSGGVLVILTAINLLGVRRPVVYIALGLVLWVAVLKSGVHATIAGVALAMTIPATMRISGDRFLTVIRDAVSKFESAAHRGENIAKNQDRQAAVAHLEEACEAVQPPLLRLEHALLPFVAFVIMPIFALANAGVPLGEGLMSALKNPIAYGIALGLFFGNQIGITGLTWIAVKTGIGSLPAGVNWRMIHGASALAGIGFTMSLFIAGLAFDDPAMLDVAKIGILLGSLISGMFGLIVLMMALRGTDAHEAAPA
ncbi:MAG: Na+/H+ antiporter NhaA [Planctomycetota bacterium]